MWKSKMTTFLLHKAGGNHREQPLPISISKQKSFACSPYQAQEWKKTNCKVKNHEFEVERERTDWNKKKKKENWKGGGEYHPSTPSKFFQIHEVRVIPLLLELVMGGVRLYEKKALNQVI